MIFQILCVRDRAADVFGTPSFHTSIGAAVRAFGDEINRAAQDNAFLIIQRISICTSSGLMMILWGVLRLLRLSRCLSVRISRGNCHVS